MVKVDMLYEIDLRLQEIMGNGRRFGGVCVLFFGDPCQIKPVMAGFPWETPSADNYLKKHLLGPHWDLFTSIILKTNHRQGEDHEYADMLNRFRVGIFNEEDMGKMRKRVFRRNDPRIPADRVSIFGTNPEVNQVNDFSLLQHDGELYESRAIVRHKTLKNYEPAIDRTRNIRNTPLQKLLQFKIGSKVTLTVNLKTTDGLTNGAMGRIVGVKVDERGILQEVHVTFFNEDVAKETYKSFQNLLSKYGVPCIAVKRFEVEYRLGKENSGVKSSATALQFPLRLAEAVTAHRVKNFYVD